MSKTKSEFVCSECGAIHAKWVGRCPDCQSWNSIVEQAAVREANSGTNRFASWTGTAGKVENLRDVEGTDVARMSTGLAELDRVLGGGLAKGAVTLVGGEPGVGKSTILLQTLYNLSKAQKALYVSGEESKQQVALRARRLGMLDGDVRIMPEIALEQIIATIEAERPGVVVIDSIQTLYSQQLQSAPGSVAQVRECAAQLTRLAKSELGVSILIVGHVNKEGDVAGPRVLEHIVDTLLLFESEPGSSFRMIRALKNRFGAANELGVFSMGEGGLEEVSNPSSMFLTAHERPVAGSAILAALEGNRPFLIEVQALVEDCATPNPKRYASGVDTSRLQMLLAVLSKHAGVVAYDQNVYIKIVGGVRLSEPAADLAVLMAAYSSLNSRPLPTGVVVFGEVGLAGEVRAVQDADLRLKEARKLGFTKAIIPRACKLKAPVTGMEVMAVSRVSEAIGMLRELKNAA